MSPTPLCFLSILLTRHAGLCLHVKCEGGKNLHHVQEACFKGLAQAIRRAVTIDPGIDGQYGTTDDLIGPAIFLCSDAANFITGQILGIDGGLTATQ